MKAVLQRVSSASVSINGRIVSSIEKGVVILLGITHDDTETTAACMANKCIALRILEDSEGKMNHSLIETKGKALVISQFTLYGDTKKGRRPSFTEAAPYQKAKNLYEHFVQTIKKKGIHAETGEFGAKMLVSIHNDGPVTLILESEHTNHI